MAVTLIDQSEATLTIAEVADTLRDAAANGLTVMVGYDHPRNGPSARVVTPREVVTNPVGNGGPYVRTIDRIRNGHRTFRLDRITSIDRIG